MRNQLMPAQLSGELNHRAYVDVIAWSLQQNGAPVGDIELPADPTLRKTFIVKFGPMR